MAPVNFIVRIISGLVPYREWIAPPYSNGPCGGYSWLSTWLDQESTEKWAVGQVCKGISWEEEQGGHPCLWPLEAPLFCDSLDLSRSASAFCLPVFTHVWQVHLLYCCFCYQLYWQQNLASVANVDWRFVALQEFFRPSYSDWEVPALCTEQLLCSQHL